MRKSITKNIKKRNGTLCERIFIAVKEWESCTKNRKE